MDVVPATPPTGASIRFPESVKDGYIWGRGAIDMKGEAVAQLMAMIALKRSGIQLNRDIVFIANADEELNSTGGIVFVKNHADLLKDVEYLITEATENSVMDGKIRYFSVGVAEKRTFWQRLSVKGVPSHGSRPTKSNPVPRLVAALDKIAKYETPLHVTAGSRRSFSATSHVFTLSREGAGSPTSTKAVKNPEAREWILSDPYWNAYLRNTISLTGLSGSIKTNVIPPEATAEIDVRLLPDTDPARCLRRSSRSWETRRFISRCCSRRRHRWKVRSTQNCSGRSRRPSKEREPSAFVTTPMQTGATDRPTYRKLGIITYAIDPFKVEQAERQRGVHGNDERLAVENVEFGTRYYYDILRYVQ